MGSFRITVRVLAMLVLVFFTVASVLDADEKREGPTCHFVFRMPESEATLCVNQSNYEFVAIYTKYL